METRERRSNNQVRLSKFQQKRRDAALERQKAARNAQVQRARQLLDHTDGGDDAATGTSSDLGMQDVAPESSPAVRREPPYKFWAGQLMQPEWMVDVPENLGSDWYVTPRPEGTRCIVVATKGNTTSRTRNGLVLHQFQSSLPSGSRGQGGPPSSCLLDCVFHEPDHTYYVLDMMEWRGHDLYNCTLEFRSFWVATKMHEDGAVDLLKDEPNTYRFAPLPSAVCNPGGLEHARSGPVPFIRDGIIFRHKDGHYTPGSAPSPLSLTWKDPKTSRYFLDTDAAGVVLEHQMVVLEYRMDRTVASSDDPPIVLGKLPESFVSKMGKKLKVGAPLRFSIRDGGIQFLDGQPVGADLHFEGASNPRRGRVDSCSKILFQYHARREPLTFELLLSSTSALDVEVPVGGGDSSSPMEPESEAAGRLRGRTNGHHATGISLATAPDDEMQEAV